VRDPLQVTRVRLRGGKDLERRRELDAAAGPRAMSVASENVEHPGTHEREHRGTRRLLGEARCRSLDEGAPRDQPSQPVDEIRRRVPLGMGKKCAEASSIQRPDRLVRAPVEWTGDGLEQNPQPGPTECHRYQFGIVEGVEHVRGNLATRQDAHVATSLPKRGAQLGLPSWKLLDAHRVIGADVGCSADRRDAIGRRLLRHLDGIREIASPVVDPGQQVAV